MSDTIRMFREPGTSRLVGYAQNGVQYKFTEYVYATGTVYQIEAHEFMHMIREARPQDIAFRFGGNDVTYIKEVDPNVVDRKVRLTFQ